MNETIIEGRGFILGKPLKAEGILENVFIPFESVLRILKDGKNNGTCAWTIRIQDMDRNVYHFENFSDAEACNQAFIKLVSSFPVRRC
jgi:hypothetical protein